VSVLRFGKKKNTNTNYIDQNQKTQKERQLPRGGTQQGKNTPKIMV